MITDWTLHDSVSDGPSETEKYYPAVVWSNGAVRWNTPAIFKSTCMLDVTYFPWDQQACLLTFGSWTYTGAKVTQPSSYNFVICSEQVELTFFPRMFSQFSTHLANYLQPFTFGFRFGSAGI